MNKYEKAYQCVEKLIVDEYPKEVDVYLNGELAMTSTKALNTIQIALMENLRNKDLIKYAPLEYAEFVITARKNKFVEEYYKEHYKPREVDENEC